MLIQLIETDDQGTSSEIKIESHFERKLGLSQNVTVSNDVSELTERRVLVNINCKDVGALAANLSTPSQKQ